MRCLLLLSVCNCHLSELDDENDDDDDDDDGDRDFTAPKIAETFTLINAKNGVSSE